MLKTAINTKGTLISNQDIQLDTRQKQE